MKKFVCISLCVSLIVSVFCGCSNQNEIQSNYSDDVIVEEIVIDETESASTVIQTNSDASSITQTSSETATESQDNLSVDASSAVDPASCSHSYNDGEIQQTAQLFKSGTKKYTCVKCGDSHIATYPIEKLKLLSIGNSFSKNALWSLYEICEQAGVKEIDIAIMYIGGCSLDQHWENVQNNAATYEVFRNNSGSWKSTPNCSIESLLNEGGWDIITLQNKSEHAALEDKFSNLDNMVNYVSDKCPNAEILWHMTWAFTTDSKYLDARYQNNDTLMFKDIVNCTQNIVAQNTKIHSIVPAGTAIMNARTSKVKDIVHMEDGSHLSDDIGYYVGAFTWFGAITGMSLYDFEFNSFSAVVNQNIELIRECAQNALENPYKITQSYYAN